MVIDFFRGGNAPAAHRIYLTAAHSVNEAASCLPDFSGTLPFAEGNQFRSNNRSVVAGRVTTPATRIVTAARRYRRDREPMIRSALWGHNSAVPVGPRADGTAPRAVDRSSTPRRGRNDHRL